MDYSQVRLGPNQNSKFAEAFYLQGGNNITFGTEIVFDPMNEIIGKNNALDSSFQSNNSMTSSKPEFHKNLYIVLKHLTLSLPLKRVVNKFSYKLGLID